MNEGILNFYWCHVVVCNASSKLLEKVSTKLQKIRSNLDGTISDLYLFSFVETPRKFIIAFYIVLTMQTYKKLIISDLL